MHRTWVTISHTFAENRTQMQPIRERKNQHTHTQHPKRPSSQKMTPKWINCSVFFTISDRILAIRTTFVRRNSLPSHMAIIIVGHHGIVLANRWPWTFSGVFPQASLYCRLSRGVPVVTSAGTCASFLHVLLRLVSWPRSFRGVVCVCYISSSNVRYVPGWV